MKRSKCGNRVTSSPVLSYHADAFRTGLGILLLHFATSASKEDPVQMLVRATLLLFAVSFASPCWAQLSGVALKEANAMVQQKLYLRIDLPCHYFRVQGGGGIMGIVNAAITHVAPLVEVSPAGVRAHSARPDHLVGDVMWRFGPNDPVQYGKVHVNGGVLDISVEGLKPNNHEVVARFVGIKTLEDFKAAFARTFSLVPLQDEHPEWAADVRQAIAERRVIQGMTPDQAYCVVGNPIRAEKTKESVAAPSQAAPVAEPGVLENGDVIKLRGSNLSPSAIIGVIEKSKSRFDVGPAGMAGLIEANVPEEVIKAMVEAASGPNVETWYPRQAISHSTDKTAMIPSGFPRSLKFVNGTLTEVGDKAALEPLPEFSKDFLAQAKTMLKGKLYSRIDLPYRWVPQLDPEVEVSPDGAILPGAAPEFVAESVYWQTRPNDQVTLTDVRQSGGGLEIRGRSKLRVWFVGVRTIEDFKVVFDRTFSAVPLQNEHPEWPAEVRNAIGARCVIAGLTSDQAYSVTGTPARIDRREQNGANVEEWYLREEASVCPKTRLPLELPLRFVDGKLVLTGK